MTNPPLFFLPEVVAFAFDAAAFAFAINDDAAVGVADADDDDEVAGFEPLPWPAWSVSCLKLNPFSKLFRFALA